MANIVLSNQEYYLGQSPVYIAYIYRKINGNEMPLRREDIVSIMVSHYEYRIGVNNGIAVRGWYPVRRSDGGDFENIQISSSNLYDTIVPSSNNDAFAYTDGKVFDYNFLYIPVDGKAYYPEDGTYRTSFHVQFAVKRGSGVPLFSELSGYAVGDKVVHEDSMGNRYVFIAGQTVLPAPWDDLNWIVEGPADDILNPSIDSGTEVLTYESKTKQFETITNSIMYGHNVIFRGDIYTKSKIEDGKFMFPENDNDNINEVWLTVYDQRTGRIFLDRHEIGADVVLTSTNNDPEKHNVIYTFPTEKLPGVGIYTFQFEIEAKNVSQVDKMLCTFSIDANIGA